jgi:hypothetical protein
MKVKLMMCKDSKQKQMKDAGNKNFYEMQKSTTFHKERLLFLFNFLKFHAVNIKEFRSICELLRLYMHCKKDFFLAIDAETQSSNKEENAKDIFFLFKC